MSKSDLKPHYNCPRCHAEWEESRPRATKCPVCGNIYVVWDNYWEWTGAPRPPWAKNRRMG